MITVLHISDLHFKNSAPDQTIVIDALCNDLVEFSKKCKIDLIFFTGDLVQSGDDPHIFYNAHDAFIERVLKATQAEPTQFFICPGNHDISRASVHENQMIEAGVASKLIDLDSVNKFIDRLETSERDDTELNLVLSRMDLFEEYFSYIGSITPIRNDDLIQTYMTSADSLQVGIACFNTAWRSTGRPNDQDKGQLLIGERTIDNALRDLKSAQIRIAAFHHPIEYLKQFEQIPIEGRLISGFDFLLFGHTHSILPVIKTTPSGNALFSQAGCLYHNRDYHNGYQILQISPEQSKCEVIARTYFNGPRSFADGVNIFPKNGRRTFEIQLHHKTESPLENFLLMARPAVIAGANQHVTLAPGDAQKLDNIQEVFVVPPIATRPEEGPTIRKKNTKNGDAIVMELLQSTNPLATIYGKRETGKTSLAHYLAVRVVQGICDKPRVPFYVDIRTIGSGRQYEWEKAFASYYSEMPLTATQLRRYFIEFPLIILIDMISDYNVEHQLALENLRQIHPDTRIIRFCQEIDSISVAQDKRTADKNIPGAKHYIHSLPRNRIRELSKRRDGARSLAGADFDNLMSHIHRAQLPRNGYIISLVVWAYSRGVVLDNINTAVLIQNIVDFMLQKADFRSALRAEFDPRSKEIILQSLSVHLTAAGGSEETFRVVEFTQAFFHDKGLEFSALDIINKLKDCGILLENDNHISFRFKCFQEYFFALAMRDNVELYQKTVEREDIFNFARELDLYTSLQRYSGGLIDKLISVLDANTAKGRFVRRHSFVDAILHQGGIGLDQSRINEIKQTPLSVEQIDNTMDFMQIPQIPNNSDKRSMGKGDDNSREKSFKSLKTLGKEDRLKAFFALDLLGRVVKNAEYDSRELKIRGLKVFFDYWDFLNSAAIRSFQHIRKGVKSEGLPPELTTEDLDKLENFFMVSTPGALSMLMHDEVASPKLIPLLESFAGGAITESGARLLVLFVLLDMRVKGGIVRILEFARSNSRRPFLLRVIHQRLVQNYLLEIHAADERPILENTIAEIEVLLGESRSLKGAIIAARQKDKSIDTLKEAGKTDSSAH